MTRAHRLLAGVLAAGALTLAGCAQSVEPIERLGRKAAHEAGDHIRHKERGPAADLARLDGRGGSSTHDRRSEPRTPATPAAYRRWGLTAPPAAAPQPPTRTEHPAPHGDFGTPGTPGTPRVVDHVPTTDKVVFLTFDDGAERDPRFVRMVRELRLPVSMFLTDSVAGPGYVHLARLRAVGATVQNHTLDHPYLPALSYAGQRWEICRQQDKLKERFGVRPTLLRPPHGAYDQSTLRAAATCGITSVVTDSTDAGPGTSGPGENPPLRPGAVLHSHAPTTATPGTSLTIRTTQLLRHIQSQGYAVGRLEDYVG